MALRRIQSDIKDIYNYKTTECSVLDGIDYFYDEDNLTIGYGLVRGSVNTPYYQGFYLIKFVFPDTYPYEPPKCTHIKFCDKRQSPNFHDDGTICVSRLNTWNHKDTDRWLPSMDISSVLIMIRAQVLTELPLDNEPSYNHSILDPLNSKKYDEFVRYCNYRYNVVKIYQKLKYHDLDISKILCGQISHVILSHIKAHKDEYIYNMTELKNLHEGKYYNCATYVNSNTYCEYQDTLDLFKKYMGFADKIKIKMRCIMPDEGKKERQKNDSGIKSRDGSTESISTEI